MTNSKFIFFFLMAFALSNTLHAESSRVAGNVLVPQQYKASQATGSQTSQKTVTQDETVDLTLATPAEPVLSQPQARQPVGDIDVPISPEQQAILFKLQTQSMEATHQASVAASQGVAEAGAQIPPGVNNPQQCSVLYRTGGGSAADREQKVQNCVQAFQNLESARQGVAITNAETLKAAARAQALQAGSVNMSSATAIINQ